AATPSSRSHGTTGGASCRLRSGRRTEAGAMATVNTVRGVIDTAQLGRVLMHEHVFVITPEIEEKYPAFDEEAEVANAVARLNELKANDIDTIVDLTVIGLGRYLP